MSRASLRTALPELAMLVAVLLLSASLVRCGMEAERMSAGDVPEDVAVSYPTMDSLTMTYVNDSTQPPITVYVVTDSDTGVDYLVTDRGGITPRLEADDG